MNGAKDPKTEFRPKGSNAQAGRPVPHRSPGTKPSRVYWPVLGEIIEVFAVDSGQNISAKGRGGQD